MVLWTLFAQCLGQPIRTDQGYGAKNHRTDNFKDPVAERVRALNHLATMLAVTPAAADSNLVRPFHRQVFVQRGRAHPW